MSNTHHSHAYASLYAHVPITSQASGVTFQRNSYSRLCFSHRFNSNGYQKYYTVFRKTAWKPMLNMDFPHRKKDFTMEHSFRNSTVFSNTTKLFSIWCLLSRLLQFSCKKNSCRNKCLNKDKTCHILPSLTSPHIAFFHKFININNWKHWCSLLGY